MLHVVELFDDRIRETSLDLVGIPDYRRIRSYWARLQVNYRSFDVLIDSKDLCFSQARDEICALFVFVDMITMDFGKNKSCCSYLVFF